MFRVGTRGSPLALAQTRMVVAALGSVVQGNSFSEEIITTTGDLKQSVIGPVARDKREWILEIEDALISGKIDFAVHSAKDVPAEVHQDTRLLPVLQREDARDALILPAGKSSTLAELAQGATIGSSSLRRQAQLLSLRPDLKILPVRGNVQSRIKKLDESGELSALVLAAAGIKRLGLANRINSLFDPLTIVPAVNQGLIVLQFLTKRSEIGELLFKLVDAQTQLIWQFERTIIKALGCDCRSAVGVYAWIENNELCAVARVLTKAGTKKVEAIIKKPKAEAAVCAEELANNLILQGALEILALL